MHFEMKMGKTFQTGTTDTCTDKGIAKIISYHPRFVHVKESCKACLQKQESSHKQKYLKAGFENQF